MRNARTWPHRAAGKVGLGGAEGRWRGSALQAEDEGLGQAEGWRPGHLPLRVKGGQRVAEQAGTGTEETTRGQNGVLMGQTQEDHSKERFPWSRQRSPHAMATRKGP